MINDSYEPRLLTPPDVQAPQRLHRLQALRLGRPEPAFDDFARKLAQTTDMPWAMVNFLDEHGQFFAGLYTARTTQPGVSAPVTPLEPGRRMSRDQGFCPHVVARRRALVLEDVCAWPRFAGNAVVDQLGIRTYMGAPLIDHTGTALGTICVVGPEPRAWGQKGLTTIKALAAELSALIDQREHRPR
ncbi:GAF domain-containing protein [Micromonospora sagamiensis]|uniref:GAF domain-containing protein n=1 Tax=Micromonospora sagamiensis TaxID=47875 RepID=A0A562WQ85_9ACTN|nr:GAF domain-containing protein [Micromonospora sagamiensis]TWJ32291.1 GAF domain-containing protein [Micromonospora sagamiensis]BCL14645.1 histidine kinase [Micromonospora sagamiensis]